MLILREFWAVDFHLFNAMAGADGLPELLFVDGVLEGFKEFAWCELPWSGKENHANHAFNVIEF